MRLFRSVLFLAVAAAQSSPPQIPIDDAIRIREFYRLAAQTQDQLWTNWSQTPSPLLLVTPEAEFLTHHPSPPHDFQETGDGFYARPRKFPTDMLATFPTFGPPAVIVIGEPANTEAKSSTPWLFTVLHEHFHQLQYGMPGYQQAVEKLGLARGDNTGMWMLNYPFPYERPAVVEGYARLRDALLA